MKYGIYFSICFSLFFILFQTKCFSQTRSELETRRKTNLKEIEVTRKILEKTREKRSYSLYQVNLLEKQIEKREELILLYEQEIAWISNQWEKAREKARENEQMLKKLREQYARIIRNSYKNIDDEYALMYILSSEDFNQSYERIRYIKYLNDYRKNLFDDIQDKTDSLYILQYSLDSLRFEKTQSIKSLQTEKDNLYKDRRLKNKTVNSLRIQEKELLAEIKEREKTQRNIENEIRRIIEEEARKAREANEIYALTPEEKLISDDFSKNKGGLPWPALQGIVTGKYGEHSHPVIPGIKIRSNGIDLSTVENTEVRAVFKGEVTVVSAILGANYTVIIKHGDYRTVYQNLVDVQVKRGDKVETKQIIGVVGTNMDKETKLHFELWKGMDVVDPEIWLSK